MKDWFKTKCTERQELVIAGYVPSTTSSKMVGSRVTAVYDLASSCTSAGLEPGSRTRSRAVCAISWRASKIDLAVPVQAYRRCGPGRPLVNLSLWRRWSCEARRATVCFGTPLTRGSETTRTQPRSFAKAQRVAPSLQPGTNLRPYPSYGPPLPIASRSRVWRSSTPTLQMGAAAPCRATLGARALPIGAPQQMLLPEARLEGMGDDIKRLCGSTRGTCARS